MFAAAATGMLGQKRQILAVVGWSPATRTLCSVGGRLEGGASMSPTIVAWLPRKPRLWLWAAFIKHKNRSRYDR